MTPAEFARRFGREPINDDVERVTCERAGEFGHALCGVCPLHDSPRFLCCCGLPAPHPSGRVLEVLVPEVLFAPFETDGPPGASLLPVLLRMPGSSASYLPAFSHAAELRSFMGRASLPFDVVCTFEDPEALRAALRAAGDDIRIILNPSFTPHGSIHYLEVGSGDA